MDKHLFPFSNLSDSELSEVIGNTTHNLLSFNLFDQLVFNSNIVNDSTDPLNYCDPDQNVTHNLQKSLSNYYHQTEFELELQSSEYLLPMMFYNIRSVPCNLESFIVHHLLNVQDKLQILGLSETRLSEDIEHLYPIAGFKLFTANRNRQGGGVSLYINNNTNCCIINEMCIKNKSVESLFVEITVNDRPELVGVMYRRPNSELDLFMDTFLKLLNQIICTKKVCYIMGDFNLDLLKYNSRKSVQEFVNLFYAHCFYPCINKPTRIGTHSASIIDHIWSNDIHTVLKNGILLSDVSDHFAPFVCRKSPGKHAAETVSITFRNYKNCNSEDLCSAMEAALKDYHIVDDVNMSYEAFSYCIQNVINSCFPWKTIKIKEKTAFKPWLSGELLEHIKTRHKMYKKFLRKPITFGNQYRQYRNKVNLMLNNAKKEYYNNKLNMVTGGSKETWRVLNELLNRNMQSKNRIESLYINDVKVSDSKTLCNYLNTYFSSVGRILANNLPSCETSPLHYMRGNYPMLELAPVQTEEVCKVIKELRYSGPGHDGIHTKVIKEAVHIVSPSLVELVNKSFLTGIFPDKLKVAKIIPIYKGGDPLQVSNYRPISILSVISKIIERLFYARLLDFLSYNNILVDNQFGFRKNFSPQTAILKMLNEVTQSVDERNYTIGVFLDLRKAFDTIDHKVLLKKLEYYGVGAVPLRWCESYLTNRYQYVEVNGVKSLLEQNSYGVPQGSTLGPLLFLLYINDMVNASDTLKFVLFADDTSVYHSGSNIILLANEINTELQKISHWLLINRLSLNVTKTHFLVFAGNKPVCRNINIVLCDESIERCHSTKFLGVYVDDKLRWEEHIQYIYGKMSKVLGIIYKVKNELPKKSLLILYYSLLYPFIQYCNVVWGAATRTTLRPLLMLQKRIIRVVSCAAFLEHAHPLFKELNVLEFYDIHKLESAKFMYHQLSINPTLIFNRISNIHSHSTRDNNNLRPPKPNTELSKRFITYSGCILWNSLPEELQVSPNAVTFKINVKKYILSQY